MHAQIESTRTSNWDSRKSMSLTHSAMRSQQIGLQTSLNGTQSQLAALETHDEGADQINS